MKKMTKTLLAAAAMLSFTSTAAFAVPIVLPTKTILEIKYQNWEKLIDNNGNSIIDTGDKIVGIVNVSSIETIFGTNQTYSTSSSIYELTGKFQLSVVGGSGIPLGGTGHIDFDMNSGDYFNFYYDAAKNFDAQAANSTTLASDGNLWMSVTGASFLHGQGDAAALPSGGNQTLNNDWFNPTVNNTGYTFQPHNWPLEPLGEAFPNPDLSQFFLQGKVTDLLLASEYQEGWTFKSEDPAFAVANPVPEPGTMVLLGMGLTGLAIAARRRKSNV